jgi:hypothetical protein
MFENQAGKFSRKIRNCKTCSDVAFHGQICMDVNQQLQLVKANTYVALIDIKVAEIES